MIDALAEQGRRVAPTRRTSPMNSLETRHSKCASGFTLIELLVVLAILGLLAGLVGPRVLNQLGGAKSKTATVQIADLEKALELFKLDVGRMPTSEESLAALMARPATVSSGWAGPYLKGTVPEDPWGRPYRYKLNADGTIEILSLGADGAPGGDGENADLRNRP